MGWDKRTKDENGNYHWEPSELHKQHRSVDHMRDRIKSGEGVREVWANVTDYDELKQPEVDAIEAARDSDANIEFLLEATIGRILGSRSSVGMSRELYV